MSRSEPMCLQISCRASNIAVWDWNASSANATSTVVLLHATGFHARCWDEVVRSLPNTIRCICIDVPGHGLSSVLPKVSWRAAAREVVAVLSHPSLQVSKELLLVGHSMGGHISAAIAAMLGGRCSALLLIDPVIMPAVSYQDQSPDAVRGMEATRENVSRRKAMFHSAEEMFERFKGRFPYVTWEPRVLRDYCEHGLGPPGSDGMRPLLCMPAVEGANYVYGSSPDADLSQELSMLAKWRQRVVVLRAPQDPERVPFRGSPTDPLLAKRLGDNASDVLLKGVNHFIPMIKPKLVSRYIEYLATASARL